MFLNVRLPVIILSSQRVGSSALLFELEEYFKNYKPTCLSEPLNYLNYNDINVLENLKKTVDSFNFIIKLHTYDMFKYYPNYFPNILEFCYVIRLRRKNLLEQCTSAYISRISTIWLNTPENNKKIDNVEIPIDFEVMTKTIRHVLALNKKQNTFKYNYDCEVYYEDLKLSNIRTEKPNKVKNYEILQNLVSKMIVEQKDLYEH